MGGEEGGGEGGRGEEREKQRRGREDDNKLKGGDEEGGECGEGGERDWEGEQVNASKREEADEEEGRKHDLVFLKLLITAPPIRGWRNMYQLSTKQTKQTTPVKSQFQFGQS